MMDKYWGNLSSISSLSYQLANKIASDPKVTLIISPDNLSSSELLASLEFYLGSMNDIDIRLFPDWETLPYDNFSPHQDIISERLSILYRLPTAKKLVVICSINTLMHRLAPQHFLDEYCFMISKKDMLDRHQFTHRLQMAGYRFVNNVMEHGECAVRGSIIDLYPNGASSPIRLDLFDDEIDSIRLFCPETQRSFEKLDCINILPANEFPLNDRAITLFRKQWRSYFTGNPVNSPIYNDVSDGISPSGVEYYLPLFFESTMTLFDYIPDDSNIIRLDKIHENASRYWDELSLRYEQRRFDITKPLMAPEDLFIRPEEIFGKCKSYNQTLCHEDAVNNKSHAINFSINPGPDLFVENKKNQPLSNIKDYLDKKINCKILMCVESAGRREVLTEMFNDVGIIPVVVQSWHQFLESNPGFYITISPLAKGYEDEENKLYIITESQLFDNHVSQKHNKSRKSYNPDVIIKNLTELRIGAPVVHIEHGVGRYMGLCHMNFGDYESEFIHLEYSGSDKIYVPVTSLHLLSRYSGQDSEHVILNKLGTDKWKKDKEKAAKSITDVAVKLLDVYSKRAMKTGFSYTAPDDQYRAFVSKFPFEETPDQSTAIMNILSDMQSQNPMDRLICGDVGFGKTEVAMRASFLAVQNKKQVCVLVPTTLLAGQHFENFKDRFADFAVNIELLSRFRSKQEVNATLDKLEHGLVDIVIGTHKLIQKNIAFKNLGLIIIDEEHRFGVQQKEYLKAMRHEVDVLSLTATPIPRSLNLSMTGLRDISIIATPPAKRLAIKTFWQETNNVVIREAILREILRGGQVFYLHNNVETINAKLEMIRELVPEANIDIAHGQMRERQLERIMSDFYHHRFNVLICTTIIETGIDIPTANTIIIDRADKLGLAQLHQLRGRVGRSHHQAYAYLLTPNKKALTTDAVKRLDAITSIEDLGAGFMLATHDLEIRGAGELLGKEQSGKMHTIGYNLYMDLLDKAVAALKSGKDISLLEPMNNGAEIEFKINITIPESYIHDVHLRLTFYKRIASADSEQQLNDLQVEMIDRFGLLPQSVKHLFAVTKIKLQANELGIVKFTMNARGGKVEFSKKPNVKMENILRLIQVHGRVYKLDGADKIKLIVEAKEAQQRIDAALKFIHDLSC